MSESKIDMRCDRLWRKMHADLKNKETVTAWDAFSYLYDLNEEMLEALKAVVAFHESQKEAQTRHYCQPFYENMKRDGLKYDVSVLSTFPLYEAALAVIAKAEGVNE